MTDKFNNQDILGNPEEEESTKVSDTADAEQPEEANKSEVEQAVEEQPVEAEKKEETAEQLAEATEEPSEGPAMAMKEPEEAIEEPAEDQAKSECDFIGAASIKDKYTQEQIGLFDTNSDIDSKIAKEVKGFFNKYGLHVIAGCALGISIISLVLSNQVADSVLKFQECNASSENLLAESFFDQATRHIKNQKVLDYICQNNYGKTLDQVIAEQERNESIEREYSDLLKYLGVDSLDFNPSTVCGVSCGQCAFNPGGFSINWRKARGNGNRQNNYQDNQSNGTASEDYGIQTLPYYAEENNYAVTLPYFPEMDTDTAVNLPYIQESSSVSAPSSFFGTNGMSYKAGEVYIGTFTIKEMPGASGEGVAVDSNGIQVDFRDTRKTKDAKLREGAELEMKIRVNGNTLLNINGEQTETPYAEILEIY